MGFTGKTTPTPSRTTKKQPKPPKTTQNHSKRFKTTQNHIEPSYHISRTEKIKGIDTMNNTILSMQFQRINFQNANFIIQIAQCNLHKVDFTIMISFMRICRILQNINGHYRKIANSLVWVARRAQTNRGYKKRNRNRNNAYFIFVSYKRNRIYPKQYSYSF